MTRVDGCGSVRRGVAPCALCAAFASIEKPSPPRPHRQAQLLQIRQDVPRHTRRRMTRQPRSTASLRIQDTHYGRMVFDLSLLFAIASSTNNPLDRPVRHRCCSGNRELQRSRSSALRILRLSCSLAPGRPILSAASPTYPYENRKSARN